MGANGRSRVNGGQAPSSRAGMVSFNTALAAWKVSTLLVTGYPVRALFVFVVLGTQDCCCLLIETSDVGAGDRLPLGVF